MRQFDYRFYDSLSRLIEADYNNGANVYNYGYDVAGNMVNYDGVTRTYNVANQMTNDGTNTLTYDNNGNLTAVGSDTYTWDRANRLLSHDGLDYAYDGAGNRISQDNGTDVTKYLLDIQPQLAKVLSQTVGSDTDYFVHGIRGIHAQKIDSNWEYLAQDGLMSVRSVIDANASVSQSVSYTPYGVPDTSIDKFAFTGEQRDANGLQYHRARYYDAGLGIWTAEDFLETPNRYGYVDGNPINFVDKNGLQSSSVLDPSLWDDIARGFGQTVDDIIRWGDDVVSWGAPIGRRIRSAIARRGGQSFAISQLDSPFVPLADFVGLAYMLDGIIRPPTVSQIGRVDQLPSVPTFDNPNIIGQGSVGNVDVIIPPIVAPYASNAVPSQSTLDAYYRCLILNSGACNQPLEGLIPGIDIDDIVYAARGGDRVQGVAGEINVGRSAKTGECNSCPNGTFCVVDRVATGNSKSDEVCPGQDHYHKYKYNQNPQTCTCYLRRANPYVNCLPPGGMPPISDCTHTII